MKTIELKLFEFNELSDKAKENAINQMRESRMEYVWADEALESLRAFVKVLGASILDYSIDWLNPSQSFVDVTTLDINHDFKFQSDDYSLTGYCMDYPLTSTWNKTSDVYESIHAWLDDCASDYEYQISDQGIEEFLEMNEYEFTEQGNIY